jgi:hypothetical protein
MKAENKNEDRTPPARACIDELTLRIAERANQIAQQRGMPPGCEFALWLEAEAEVKRDLRR